MIGLPFSTEGTSVRFGMQLQDSDICIVIVDRLPLRSFLWVAKARPAVAVNKKENKSIPIVAYIPFVPSEFKLLNDDEWSEIQEVVFTINLKLREAREPVDNTDFMNVLFDCKDMKN